MKKLSKKETQHYFKLVNEIENNYFEQMNDLEEIMQDETGIEDLEFFWCDNEVVGIGNKNRTIKLIHR